MQLLTCADQHPPRPETLDEHGSILFMLNCYEEWGVTLPSPAEAEAVDETDTPNERRCPHA